MTKQELREHLFGLYSANLTLCFPNVKGTFLCPFCLKTFGRDAIQGDEKKVILAHCVQESLGGRSVTLACAGCDCPAGHEIDVHLINRLQTTEFFGGTSLRSQRVWLHSAGHRVRADYSIIRGSDGRVETDFKIDGKELAARPVAGDAGGVGQRRRSEAPHQGNPAGTNVLQHGRVAGSPAAIGLPAYVPAFRPQLRPPREPGTREAADREAYGADYPRAPRDQSFRRHVPKEHGVVVTEPAQFNAFLAVLVFRTDGGSKWAFGVFMPGLDDGDSVYERIHAHQSSNESVGVKFATWDDEGATLDKPEAVTLPYEIWAGLRGSTVDAPSPTGG